MVKAGVYLVALLAPGFADAAAAGGRWSACSARLTMLLGGWRALRQHDIKLLLAYGTVSQLGFLMCLCGLGTQAAALGGLAMLIAHALFKSTLFLVVGVVDHSRRHPRPAPSCPGSAAACPWSPVTGGARRPRRWPACRRLLGFVAKEAAFEALTYLVGTPATAPGCRRCRRLLLLAARGRRVGAHRRLHAAVPLGRLRRPSPGCTRPPAAPAAGRLRWSPRSLLGCGLPGRRLRRRPADRGAAAVRRYGRQPGTPAHGIWRCGTASPPRWRCRCSPLSLGCAAVLAARTRSRGCRPPSRPSVGAERGLPSRRCAGSTGSPSRSPRAPSAARCRSTSAIDPARGGGPARRCAAARRATGPARSDLWRHRRQVAGRRRSMIAAAVLAATSRGRLKAVVLVGRHRLRHGGAVPAARRARPRAHPGAGRDRSPWSCSCWCCAGCRSTSPTARCTRTRWWRLVHRGPGRRHRRRDGRAWRPGPGSPTPVSEAFSEAAYTFGGGKNIVNVTLVDIRAWDTMGEISVLVVAATGVASLIFLRAATPADRRGRRPRRQVRRAERPARGQRHRVVAARRAERSSPGRARSIFEVVTRLLFHADDDGLASTCCSRATTRPAAGSPAAWSPASR